MSEPTGNPVSEASDSEWCRPRCGPDPERLNAAGTKPNDVARWVPMNTKIKGALVRVRISTLMSIKQLHWAELPDPAFLMFPRLSQLPLSPNPDPTPHCPESRLSNNFAIPIGKAKP